MTSAKTLIPRKVTFLGVGVKTWTPLLGVPIQVPLLSIWSPAWAVVLALVFFLHTGFQLSEVRKFCHFRWEPRETCSWGSLTPPSHLRTSQSSNSVQAAPHPRGASSEVTSPQVLMRSEATSWVWNIDRLAPTLLLAPRVASARPWRQQPPPPPTYLPQAPSWRMLFPLRQEEHERKLEQGFERKALRGM